MSVQVKLNWLGFYRDKLLKEGVILESHRYLKNQEIVKLIDKFGHRVTKQYFNPDRFGGQKVIVRFNPPQPLNFKEGSR